MLFDKKVNDKNSFILKVKPEDYGDLNKPLPDEVPKPNVGCGIHTGTCQGLIFSWIVSSEQAMDYDDVEGTIISIRQYLTGDSGIVECKNGVTAKGYKYIYNIQKMRYFEEGMSAPEVSYNLNFNINVDGTDYFINGNYVEIGMTGMRDSVGFAMFQKALEQKHPDKRYTTEEIMEMFFKDPYDGDYKDGFLMNVAENDFLDGDFPDHPLSMLRKYINWVIENN